MKSITELAKSVGYPMLVFMGTPYVSPELRRLVEAAVEQEREACAKVCDAFQARDVGMQPAECAGAIRARSNT
jgi:hypothetical protein